MSIETQEIPVRRLTLFAPLKDARPLCRTLFVMLLGFRRATCARS